MTPVTSSFVEAVGYDPEARELHVRLAGGRGYRYLGVPASVFEEFLAAPSKGTFFNGRVKHNYDWEPL